MVKKTQKTKIWAIEGLKGLNADELAAAIKPIVEAPGCTQKIAIIEIREVWALECLQGKTAQILLFQRLNEYVEGKRGVSKTMVETKVSKIWALSGLAGLTAIQLDAVVRQRLHNPDCTPYVAFVETGKVWAVEELQARSFVVWQNLSKLGGK